MINKVKVKSEFNRNILTLMTGTTIAQAIPISISPILTRIYTPEDFGLFAIFVAISAILGSIVNGKYELAIMLPKKDEDAINILALSFIINCVISFILLVLIVFFNDSFVALLRNEELKIWLYFVPLAVFLIGIFNILRYYNNRKKQYKDLAKATIIKSVSTAIVQLSIGFIHQGASGLISGQLISHFFANNKLFKNIIKDKKLISKISKIKIIALAKKYKDFPKYSTWNTLVNTLFTNIPLFILGIYFAASTLGFYSMALRIIKIPIGILSQAISNVLTEKIINYKNNKIKYMKQIYKFLIFQVILAFFISISLIILSDYMGMIFGNDWNSLGDYMLALLPWIIMAFIISPLSFAPTLFKKQSLSLKIEILYGIIKISSLMIGIYTDDIIKALYIFSISNSIFIFLQGFWFLHLLKKNED